MEDRDDEGRFSEQYSREDFVRAVRSLNVASTQKVADEIGCSYDLAYRRLNQLEDEGEIKHEKVGRAFVWLPVDS
jgi:CTP-dependent riboflavin kinase